MSSLRSLKRNVAKNQRSLTKEDDSGGKKKANKKKPKHFNDSKSTIEYLKAMKTTDSTKGNAQNKANVSAKSKVC